MRLVALLSSLAAVILGTLHAKEPAREEWTNPVDGMRFVWIPAGNLSMANSSNVVERFEMAGFWMARTEVTVGQFSKFVKKTGYITNAERETNRWTWKNPGLKQRASHPVIFVTARDALAYCQWAGTALPTEPEWLYACSAGSTNRYYWGEQLDDRFAWYRTNSEEGTQPVGKKIPNAWGLYDMVGNAWEYCLVTSCNSGPQCITSRGSAWSRCPSYLTRQGTVAENLIAVGVQPPLTPCDRISGLTPYPSNDDRGFRCVKRVKP